MREQSKNHWSTYRFRYIDLLTGRFIVSIFSIAYFNWHSRSASREPSTHQRALCGGSMPIAGKRNRNASLWEKVLICLLFRIEWDEKSSALAVERAKICRFLSNRTSTMRTHLKPSNLGGVLFICNNIFFIQYTISCQLLTFHINAIIKVFINS